MSDQPWGRVDAEGTVWVRTAEGERAVGSYPGATQEEALAYFTRKYDDLAAQITLLEQRMAAGQVSPADAAATIERLTAAVADAHAVGDLASLTTRLESLTPALAEQKAAAEAARAKAKAKAYEKRTALVEEAEKLAGEDPARIPWRTSGDRLKELFETWQAQQRSARLDRAQEDELWKRFSHARTQFDRKRRQYFSALDDQRSTVKATKEKLVEQAQALATSTDWGPTTTAYRQLMDEWKAAGRAARKDDDALWARFRAAQDAFFAARTEAAAVEDASFAENLVVKEALLAEAEALLPVTDLNTARNALRHIQEKWERAGKVPRNDLQRVEGRLRAVETALRTAEQDKWRRSNPEAHARAADLVGKLERTIADLEKDLAKARDAGNQRKIAEAEQALVARNEWLAQARSAMEEFTG